MRVTIGRLAVGVAVVAGMACGPKPGSAPPPPPVAVRVTNQNRADVVVSLVRSGSVVRLGTVVSGQTQVLTIRNVPLQRLQGIQFDIHRIGAEQDFRTRAVSLGPEQMVVLRIEDLLSSSQISVAEDASEPGKRMP
jgi:hypothetical protein